MGLPNDTDMPADTSTDTATTAPVSDPTSGPEANTPADTPEPVVEPVSDPAPDTPAPDVAPVSDPASGPEADPEGDPATETDPTAGRVMRADFGPELGVMELPMKNVLEVMQGKFRSLQAEAEELHDRLTQCPEEAQTERRELALQLAATSIMLNILSGDIPGMWGEADDADDADDDDGDLPECGGQYGCCGTGSADA